MDFNTNDFHTYTCDFDTLRVKFFYYNIYINPNYRYMPAARILAELTLRINRTILRVVSTRICEDSTRMRAGSTRMRVQNLYFNMIDFFFINNSKY
jgi:hypothetical protein